MRIIFLDITYFLNSLFMVVIRPKKGTPTYYGIMINTDMNNKRISHR